MKTITEIRNEKPYYFVVVKGDVAFESESIKECKDFLCKYLKENKIDEEEVYTYYIAMYSISLF